MTGPAANEPAGTDAGMAEPAGTAGMAEPAVPEPAGSEPTMGAAAMSGPGPAEPGAGEPVSAMPEAGQFSAPRRIIAAKQLRRVPLVNLANAMTVLRIGLVPIFIVLMVTGQMHRPGYRMAAAVAFAAAALTDLADGWIARSFNLVTAFGKIADPIADKALTGTALVLLSVYQALAWWVTIVILVRELGITVLRFWVMAHGVIPASRGGKAKTVVQLVAITWYIWPFPDVLAGVGPWLMMLAVAVTLVSGVDYVARAVRLRRLAADGVKVGHDR